VFVEFILLVDRIKCGYNTPLQVLTNAPALHSLIICKRGDAARILKFLFRSHTDLRKLILKYCWLGEDGTGHLANIVALYPDLEVLSLESCHPLTHAGYGLIPRLKKLSELNVSDCEVDYVYVKLLETRVFIHELV
jgi:Ran GTPase-activating protein (RanGAP) involved in mRNA processing and transport